MILWLAGDFPDFDDFMDFKISVLLNLLGLSEAVFELLIYNSVFSKLILYNCVELLAKLSTFQHLFSTPSGLSASYAGILLWYTLVVVSIGVDIIINWVYKIGYKNISLKWNIKMRSTVYALQVVVHQGQMKKKSRVEHICLSTWIYHI